MDYRKIVQMDFPKKMSTRCPQKFQIDVQHFWLGPKGPNNTAECCSPPQELEKDARTVFLFSDKPTIKIVLSLIKPRNILTIILCLFGAELSFKSSDVQV